MATPKVDKKHYAHLIKIGLKVSYYRKLRSLTQEELAEKADISRTTIAHLESPDKFHGTSLSTLFKIADALDIHVKKLFDFEGDD